MSEEIFGFRPRRKQVRYHSQDKSQSERQAELIVEYWRNRGFTVKCHIAHTAEVSNVVSSDTVNGLPRDYDGRKDLVEDLTRGKYDV